MRRVISNRSPGLPEGTYVELVRSVFATVTPTTIMGILFVLVSTFAVSKTGDAILLALCVIGTTLSLVRVALLLLYERGASREPGSRVAAESAEGLFAKAYLAFALVLGLFGARVFQVAPVAIEMLTVALLVGYSAGVAAGVSLRPWIALPSILAAIVPTVVVVAFGSTSDKLLAITLSAFVAGGANSMAARFRSETEKITMRRAFGDLARRDPLTGLANRLGLAEAHRTAVQQAPECLQAVHCLDLDRFKAVNDRHGHPAGDALLAAVADRLVGLLREGDIAARLGGDEFAVLQTGMHHAGEAELLARRIGRAIAEPYSIGELQLSIGASIGFVVTAECDDALDDLVASADIAAYAAKRRGGGTVEEGMTADGAVGAEASGR